MSNGTTGEARRGAGGRPPVMTPEMIARARKLRTENKRMTLAEIGAELGCSARTVSRMLAIGEAENHGAET